MRMRWKGWMGLALAAGALTACDTGTGPVTLDSFDAEAALDDYQAMDQVLGSEGWKGFVAMGGAVSLETFGPSVQIALGSAMDVAELRGSAQGGAAAARRFAGRMVELGAMSPRAAAAPIISTLHRGKTFVYDPDAGRYMVDESLTGAPATGVRFIVYRDVGGKPDVAQPLGHADLIDEGDGSVQDIALRLLVVEGDRTVLNYRATLDENAGHGAITVGGFIRGDVDQLDFNIDVSGSEGSDQSALDVDFNVRIDNRAFEIQGSVHGVEQGKSEMGDVDLTVRHGSESLRVDVSGTESTVSGTFYLNGDVFATISGDPDEPTFTSADGDPLTGAEALVLHRIVDIVEDVFDLFEDLLDPVDDLLILAVIL